MREIVPVHNSVKGIYVLIVSVDKDIKVDVGALGSIFFEAGLYGYVGSAQNGLKNRIEMHLRKDKRKFWHIDYLLDNDAAEVVEVFWKEADRSEECEIASELCEKAVPVTGFGCSDCSCLSHLFKLKDYSIGKLAVRLGQSGLDFRQSALRQDRV